MDISISSRIEKLVKDSNLKERLLNFDPKAISELGKISQQDIKPTELIESYENNSMEILYKKAKLLTELNELYNHLCDEYIKSKAQNKNINEER